MVSRESIRNIIMGYMPEVDDIRLEWLASYVSKEVELKIYKTVRDVILAEKS